MPDPSTPSNPFAAYPHLREHCAVPGCNRLTAFALLVKRRGPGLHRGGDRRFCTAHYRRWERTGQFGSGRIREYCRRSEP